MDNVVIEIHSLQDGKETGYLFTDGTLSRKGKDIVLEFEGTELCGKNGEMFSMKISDNRKISLALENDDSTEFIIEQGHKHLRVVDDRNLFVGIDTQMINSNVTETGGTVDFKYILDYNNHSAVMKEMKVSVRSKKQ